MLPGARPPSRIARPKPDSLLPARITYAWSQLMLAFPVVEVQRTELKHALTSCTKMVACSQAAKCPPRSSSFQ